MNGSRPIWAALLVLAIGGLITFGALQNQVGANKEDIGKIDATLIEQTELLSRVDERLKAVQRSVDALGRRGGL